VGLYEILPNVRHSSNIGAMGVVPRAHSPHCCRWHWFGPRCRFCGPGLNHLRERKQEIKSRVKHNWDECRQTMETKVNQTLVTAGKHVIQPLQVSCDLVKNSCGQMQGCVEHLREYASVGLHQTVEGAASCLTQSLGDLSAWFGSPTDPEIGSQGSVSDSCATPVHHEPTEQHQLAALKVLAQLRSDSLLRVRSEPLLRAGSNAARLEHSGRVVWGKKRRIQPAPAPTIRMKL